MRVKIRRGSAAGAVALVALLAGGCGGSDEKATSGGAAAATATQDAGSQDRYASVLDKPFADAKDDLGARSVDAGGTKIAFDEGEKLKIAFFGFGKIYDYSKPEYAAADALAKELGIEIDSFDPAGDPQKGVTQIQDAMTSGKYNAMVVYPLSTDLDCNLLSKQVPSKGILVAAVGNPACTDANESPGILTTVPDTGTLDVYQAWADAIMKDQSGGGKAIMLAGPKLDHLSQLAVQAVGEQAKAAGNIDIVSTLYTDYTQPDALQKVQDALQAHGDATAIISMFPENTQTANTAIKVAGKAGKIALYDFGTNASGMKNVKSGAVKVSVPYYPYTKVKAAIQALVIARRGGTVPRYIPYAGHAPESIRPAGSDVMIVTPEDVDDFARLVAEY